MLMLISRHGIGKVMDMALGWIGSDTPIHLSFDIDALDPMWAPSTGTAVRGGLTLREGDFIAECVAETGSLIALDLVEVNPSLDEYGASDTVRAGKQSRWSADSLRRIANSARLQAVQLSAVHLVIRFCRGGMAPGYARRLVLIELGHEKVMTLNTTIGHCLIKMPPRVKA